MEIYTPVLNYPKRFPIDMSADDRSSFDIDNWDQAAKFITDAIEEICKDKKTQPDSKVIFKVGLIVEGMLEDNFGANAGGLPFREFVMGYVKDNFEKASKKHDLMVQALKVRGLV